MITLQPGVELKRAFEGEAQKIGKGTLYVLNTGVVFEVRGKGIGFDIGYESLTSYEAVKKDKIRISWNGFGIGETSGNSVPKKWNSEIKITEKNVPALQVEHTIRTANEGYAKSATLIETLRNQNKILAETTEKAVEEAATLREQVGQKETITSSDIEQIEKARSDAEKLKKELREKFPDARADDLSMMLGLFAKYPQAKVSELIETITRTLGEYGGKESADKLFENSQDDNNVFKIAVRKVAGHYYESMNNPEFVQANSDAITKIVNTKLIGESPEFVEKVVQKAISMWKTIDTEKLYESGYSQKRIAIEEIDGRIVGIGKDYGNVEIFLSMGDCKKSLNQRKLYQFMSEIEQHTITRQKPVSEMTEEQVRKKMIEDVTTANAKIGITAKPDDILIDMMTREYLREIKNVGTNAQFGESDIYLGNMVKCIDYILVGNITEAKKCRDIAVKSQIEFAGTKLPELLVPIAIDLAMEYVPRVAPVPQAQ